MKIFSEPPGAAEIKRGVLVAGVFTVSLLGTSVMLVKLEASQFRTAIPPPAPEALQASLIRSLPVISTDQVLASSFLVETMSGEVVAERDSGAVVPPASLTKIMTALILKESGDQVNVTITDQAKHVVPRLSGLPVGSVITAETAQMLMLVESDNDVAEAVAEAVGRVIDPLAATPREVFIAAMNQKARELGLSQTSFENPTGLDREGHLSSARDLAALARYVSAHYPDFWGITQNPPLSAMTLEGKRVSVQSSNLIRSHPGLVGAKTGLTTEAGGALILLYHSQYYSEDFVVVLLHSPDRFRDGERLLSAIEDAFKKSAN